MQHHLGEIATADSAVSAGQPVGYGGLEESSEAAITAAAVQNHQVAGGTACTHAGTGASRCTKIVGKR